MKPIETSEDIRRELNSLLAQDDRLQSIYQVTGNIPLRRRSADFSGLCNIIVAQLISVAAANAIWARLENTVRPFEPSVLLSLEEDVLQGVGLSRSKVRTLRAIATDMEAGLDLKQLSVIPANEAHKRLCEIKGIGRWTADIFLLFCAGHPDVFPSGDVALQNAVRDAFELSERPKGAELDTIAEQWAPHRGTAARLFWAYYKVCKDGRETLPV